MVLQICKIEAAMEKLCSLFDTPSGLSIHTNALPRQKNIFDTP